MLGSVLYVAMAVCGIEVGWQPDPQGNLQYIIQIEPEMVDTLMAGRPIEYDLPPEHRGVHRFRFQVGKGKPPRLGDPAPPKPRETAVRRPDEGGGLAPRWKPTGGPPAAPPKQAAPQEKLAVEPLKHDSPQAKLAKEPPAEPPKLELSGVPDATPPDSPSPASATPIVPRNAAPSARNNVSPNVAITQPDKLPLGLDPKPIPEQKASYDQPDLRGNSGTPAGPNLLATEKLMGPLVITSCTAVGLFAACVYLCWIYAGTRRRYQALLADYYAAIGSLPGFGPATLPDPSRDD